MVKTTGDGALVEFASAVDAVRCAVEIQRAMAERNATIPEDRRIEFRIGINVGDIIIDEGDIYGDGVNIAARVEALTSPGAICISDNAYQQIKGKLTLEISDMGEQKLKNIAQPVRVHGVRLNGTAPNGRPTLTLPDKPSVAVLPFDNMSGDVEQEYFADGMAEDIITALSRCNSLFVIARNSSFTYKGKAIDIRQVGRELGVRYVLEGSVRRAGNHLRITAQLIEAASGNHIWADRFDGELSDVFALQDRVTENVAATIEPKLQLAEIERLKNKPAANLDAYDLLLRAQQLEYEFTRESLEEALRCLGQALTIDPSYAPAMALAAYCHAWRRPQGWVRDLAMEADEGVRLASRAVELTKDDANVLWMAAYAIWQLAMDIQHAKQLAYRSLAINPNLAMALTTAAYIEINSGNIGKAVECAHRAERLNPRDPRGWANLTILAFAHFLEDRFEEAASTAKHGLVLNSRYTVLLRILAASLAKLDRRMKQQNVMRQILTIEPQLTLSKQRARSMFIAESVWSKYSEGLRLAGMPE